MLFDEPLQHGLVSFLEKNAFLFTFFSLKMVSIVEVEIIGFLPFSNWPDFDQKRSKNVIFGLKWLNIEFIGLLLLTYVLIFSNFVFKIISRFS